jgi:hypothetical protein
MFAVYRVEYFQYAIGILWIKVTRGFIRENKFRPIDKSTPDCYSLLLSAGQLRRQAMTFVTQSYQLEDIRSATAHPGCGYTENLRTVSDVLKGGLLLHQAKRLKYYAHGSA